MARVVSGWSQEAIAMGDSMRTRLEHFARWPFHWVLVRHFLSADLIEELSRALVAAASSGSLTFDALFESMRSEGPSALASYIVRPRQTDQPIGRCLQQLVRMLVGQSDEKVVFSEQGLEKGQVEFLRGITGALTLSAMDLNTLASVSVDAPSIPDMLRPLLTAMVQLNGAPEPAEEGILKEVISASTSNVAAPLNALISKHLGDLCADRDRWDDAATLYLHADTMLTDDEPAWAGLTLAVRTIVAQSLSAASLANIGPEASAGGSAGRAPTGRRAGSFCCLRLLERG
jgi:hypothetical protein